MLPPKALPKVFARVQFYIDLLLEKLGTNSKRRLLSLTKLVALQILIIRLDIALPFPMPFKSDELG